MILFEKEYDGESLYDLGRDMHEIFDEAYNPLVKFIPTDEHGIQKGRFTLKVEWEE